MSKEYSLGSDAFTLANQPVTIAFLNPVAAPAPSFLIYRLWASQFGSSTSGQARVQVVTQASVFPTLTSATPRQIKRGDSVASLIAGGTAGAQGTAGVNASNENAGSKTVMFADNFNILNGYLWSPTPRELIEMPAGHVGGLGLFLPVAPPSLSNWGTGMNYAEGI